MPKQSQFLNVKAVKQLALDAAKDRHHSFERVGADFIAAIEAAVRQAVVARVRQAPSKGKTLQ